MSLLKCLRVALLAVIPAVAGACGNATGPTPEPSATAAHGSPDVRVNARSGYVLASGRH
jgi:hypothetical protein